MRAHHISTLMLLFLAACGPQEAENIQTKAENMAGALENRAGEITAEAENATDEAVNLIDNQTDILANNQAEAAVDSNNMAATNQQ